MRSIEGPRGVGWQPPGDEPQGARAASATQAARLRACPGSRQGRRELRAGPRTRLSGDGQPLRG